MTRLRGFGLPNSVEVAPSRLVAGFLDASPENNILFENLTSSILSNLPNKFPEAGINQIEMSLADHAVVLNGCSDEDDLAQFINSAVSKKFQKLGVNLMACTNCHFLSSGNSYLSELFIESGLFLCA